MNSRHIAMFSGGKDSTAMVLRMYDDGVLTQVDDIVMADLGAEFPEMYQHVKDVEQYINRKITVLKPDKSMIYMIFSHVRRQGKRPNEMYRHRNTYQLCRLTKKDLVRDQDGKVWYAGYVGNVEVSTDTGYGWPEPGNRWCTAMKRDTIRKYLSENTSIIEYHGIAADEPEKRDKSGKDRDIRYPLRVWGMTEADCLDYCYQRGFSWGGLYEKMRRVSCYLCPLQSLPELEVVYNEYPALWKNMMFINTHVTRKFRSDYSLQELDRRFHERSLQGVLFTSKSRQADRMTHCRGNYTVVARI